MVIFFMFPAESLLCLAEQPQGWGTLCPSVPLQPPGAGLCAMLTAKLLLLVLLPAWFLT